MKNLFLLILLVFPLIKGQAQIGILAAFSKPLANDWSQIIESNGGEFLNTGINFGINHSIPIPNTGMRLLPELNYATYSASWQEEEGIGPTKYDLDLSLITFLLNSNIYLFNLEGDCDCPTWGKEGGFFEKGFFVEVGPGVTYMKNYAERNVLNSSSSRIEKENTSFRFHFNIGLGLDIGITEMFTITPFARMKWNSSEDWTNLEASLDFSKPEAQENLSDFFQQEVGIKLGIRYKN